MKRIVKHKPTLVLADTMSDHCAPRDRSYHATLLNIRFLASSQIVILVPSSSSPHPFAAPQAARELWGNFALCRSAEYPEQTSQDLQAALQYHLLASSALGGQPMPTSVK